MPFLEILPGQLTSPGGLIAAQMAVLAAMHWPNDPPARRSFFYSKAQDGLERRGIETGWMTMPSWMLRFRGNYVNGADAIKAANPPVSYISQEFKPYDSAEEVTAAEIAAMILDHALCLDDLRKAVKLETCQQAVGERLGNRMRKNLKAIRPHWAKYACVSHYWTTCMRHGSHAIHTSSSLEFSRFLLLAENLRIRGENVVVRNRGPLLNAEETWKLPSGSVWDLI